MQMIVGRNVNHLWVRAVPLLTSIGREEYNQRTGKRVLVAPCPVMSVTMNPVERVLFDPARDANPFFHLFEALWMMAGRDDAVFLDQFVRDFGERFAESDGRINGAYGKRWRRWFCLDGEHPIDQLEVAVATLRRDPSSRQAVIAMWDPATDGACYPLDWSDEGSMTDVKLKDRPCNTHVYLRLRPPERYPADRDNDEVAEGPWLDMTVCCRSNDIVWGAYGANIVHFSFLQEYLAGRLGAEVGTLYQLSNNWHAYVDVLERVAERHDFAAMQADAQTIMTRYDPYSQLAVHPLAIGYNWSRWLDDLDQFMESPERPRDYANQWFSFVARPMYAAHALWRGGAREAALRALDDVAASDWGLAARQWMMRRMKKEGE